MMSKDTNAVPSSNERTQSEQIDLIDIIQQLWAGKKIISIFVVICLILGATYAFTAQEKWSSTAIVTLPDSGQVSAYTQAMNVLYPGAAPLVHDIQTSFFSRFQGGLAALSLQLQNQEVKEELSSEALSKDRPDQLLISYVGDNAIEAQERLKLYLSKVDSSIVTDIDGDLTANINARIEELNNNVNSLEQTAQQKKDERLKVLNQALVIAEQSNIKTSQLQNSTGITDDTLFTLGSDALNSMIKNYKDSPLPLSVDYYSAIQNLLAVKSIKKDKRILSTFRYIMKPDLPVKRDSPKRLIILILSVIIGGALGAGYVLLKGAFRRGSY
ncbi:LPS O-antigen chain length determinant protein WzzB [Mangrovibacter yixingensis]|uniref:LPS O-antigen chain length determinant protein WzzB n=1 Tax=Mangrovibacter yixingensis TaxID=1529639 RepID=UPI001CFA8EC3|nr:LPS O-antigen chain length determinant protein WzzB [Mangrovibacter yixingensis]